MNSATIYPAKLAGTVTAPPSKSDAHRAILCASLAGGVSTIHNIVMSQDIKATIQCIQALGAAVSIQGNTLTVDGTGMFSNSCATLNSNESGSTLRFIIPIAAAGGVNATFIGSGRLPQRPIGIFLECLPKNGVKCTTKGGLPLEICGKLQGGTFEIAGNVSSQFITGLLLALPLVEQDSTILLTSPLQSKGYINMTIKTMKAFGVAVTETSTGYFIKGGQKYTPIAYTVEGDWSQAAFFFSAAALGGKITIKGLKQNSLQGDKACMELFKSFGADISTNGDDITIVHNKLNAIDINAEQIPDLVPILAITAALANGTTHITNAERLRIKESDRLKAICEGINSIGGNAVETYDGLQIIGVPQFSGGNANGYNDHRIVMSLAIAAIQSNGKITVSDKESINKSFPSFFEVYNSLGGKSK